MWGLRGRYFLTVKGPKIPTGSPFSNQKKKCPQTFVGLERHSDHPPDFVTTNSHQGQFFESNFPRAESIDPTFKDSPDFSHRS